MPIPTLTTEHLSASFFTDRGELRAVNDVSITVPPRSIVGLVGESGCGKSMTARAVLRLLKYPGRITSGSVRLLGQELTELSDRQMAAIRGRDVSMIFQEPMTSLNPVMKVGKQVQEALLLHRKTTKKQARQEALRLFEQVGISEAERRMDCYPHELSGGLRQRVMIAMAMICQPKLLIADEPTTALDVTVEAQILQLMKSLRDNSDTSIVLISHNLGVIAQICDYVYVMYAGQIVEQAETAAIFRQPLHPYTQGLMGAVRSLEQKDELLKTIPGTVPGLLELPQGCAFAPRCSRACEGCASAQPLVEAAPGHSVRCHRHGEE